MFSEEDKGHLFEKKDLPSAADIDSISMTSDVTDMTSEVTDSEVEDNKDTDLSEVTWSPNTFLLLYGRNIVIDMWLFKYILYSKFIHSKAFSFKPVTSWEKRSQGIKTTRII